MAGVPFNPRQTSIGKALLTPMPKAPDPMRQELINALLAFSQRASSNFNASPFSQFVNQAGAEAAGKLFTGAQSAVNALALPGDVASGRTPFDPRLGLSGQAPETLDRASDLAGAVQLGAMPMPRPSGSLGMGGNYIRDLSADTPLLYREMNSERANNILDDNLNVGAFGQDRLYWSDVPELAKGQGENTGVRMTMRSEGVQGRADTTSKPGLAFVQQTKGGREFITHSGVSFNKVDEVHISPEVLFRQSPDDRRMMNKLRSEVEAGNFETFTPDGWTTVYKRVAK